MAVDRTNLTPDPAPAPKLPVGRSVHYTVNRTGYVPPNQAATNVQFGDSEFNQGLINGG